MTLYKIIGTYYEVYDVNKNVISINLIRENGTILCIFDNWDEFENYLNIKNYKIEGNYIVTDYII